MSHAAEHIELYDTTLRDGTQGVGISLSLQDKLQIAAKLDELGFDYIEGGYPLSNPKDVAFFEEIRRVTFKHAKVAAFGMTRRRGTDPADDAGMQALVAADTPVITIVGKSWDLHVREVIKVDEDENVAMIADSVRFCRDAGRELIYDAEHFFDGYKANPEYALKTLIAAQEAGATTLVLCDTNGGSLPEFIAETVRAIRPHTSVKIGIHTHNDGGLAVANTLAAIGVGAVHAQGTINGIGERCGNVDLTTVVANLALKLGYDVLIDGAVRRMTELSRYVDELANMLPVENQPYVGSGSFAHKGGMHIHAVRRVTESYEHVPPDAVGNQRRMLVSELSGASTVTEKIGKKLGVEGDRAAQRRMLEKVQDLEHEGYMFEAAEASFELVCRRELGRHHTFWELDHFRCVILNLKGKIQTTEAIVKLRINGETEHRVSEGDGPVDALAGGLRKALRPHYPAVDQIKLVDYKVRVINARQGTAAKVRVVIEFHDADDGSVFGTVGVSENIIDASWNAIVDGIEYKLLHEEEAGRLPVHDNAS
jgi:2-isopropylmalate synthase